MVLGIKNVLDARQCSWYGKPIIVGGGTDGASININGHSDIKKQNTEAASLVNVDMVLCTLDRAGL